ncbi:MAG: alpha/beta hydrolase [Acidimicrobiia bacterium]|nr:alpha/beta hydrolase [Acidimicrobiia bacterium]
MAHKLAPSAVVVALALIAAGCVFGSGVETTEQSGSPNQEASSNNGSDNGSSDSGEGEDDPDLVGGLDRQPTIESVDCPFAEPDGVEAECHRITVPENWDTGAGNVELIVGVLPSRNDSDNAPIVYLEGGPGAHALDTLQFQFADIWDPLLDEHDLIFFDQRGTGFSEPSLRCPELTRLTRDAEDDPSLSPTQLQDLGEEALRTCATGFMDRGIDIAQYSTINNARDADAIRQSLEYDQWNLLGISYGTRLALDMMRQFPDTIRSVVIDSVYPPQIEAISQESLTFLDSFESVSAACDAEPACAAQGNLAERFIAAAADLESQPREVEVINLVTGSTDTVQATGDAIVALVAGGLYSPFAFTDWPELLTDIESGGTDALSQYLSLDRTNEAFLTAGMFYAFQCNEEVPFADPVEVAAVAPDDPFGLYDRAFSAGDFFGSCAALGAVPADPVSNEPVRSDIPTLVLAGEYDPVTPPGWSELAAETLPNSQYVLLSGESHGVAGSGCGNAMIQDFFAQPLSPVDSSCADEGTVSFLGGGNDEVIEVEQVDAAFAVGEVPITQPVEWTTQDVGGVVYSRRGRSLLDVAELLQFSGPSLVTGSLTGFITGTLGVDLTEPVQSAAGDWTVRSGSAEGVAVDFYERTRDDQNVDLILLIASDDEIDSLRGGLLKPVVEGFGVE